MGIGTLIKGGGGRREGIVERMKLPGGVREANFMKILKGSSVGDLNELKNRRTW